jgi:hypothetical protein
MYRKVENLKNAAADDAEAWQSVAMIMGFPKYMLEDADDVEIPKRRQIKIKSGFKTKNKSNKIIIKQ